MTAPSRENDRQEEAIAALLQHATVIEAAAALGVSDRTLRTWMRQPAFAQEYRRCRQLIVEHALAQVQQTTPDAVEALRGLLKCGHPPGVVCGKAVL
jgi:hypothetical protein